MSMLTISCPSCGLSRQVPADKVPEGPRSVTCPQCKQVFPFTKPVTIPIPDDDKTPPSPPPLPPPIKPLLPPQSQPSAASSQTLPPVPPSAPPKSRPAPPRGLTDIGDLFKETWQLFQRRFTTLIGLYLLTIVAFMLPVGIALGLGMLAGMVKGGTAFVLTGFIGLLVGLYLGFRCVAAFLHAVVDDRLAFREALEKGSAVIIPLIWIGFLSGFIIGGGFFLFVIPGIIFMVWFFFAQFIMIKEDVHGMNALLKSKEYVRGEWFNVALRLLLVWAASVLISVIPLAGPVLYIVFFPFVMIFHYLIYRDLREMKGDVSFPCSTVDILKWPAVSLAGFLIVPLVLVSLAGVSLFSRFSNFVPPGTTGIQNGAPMKVDDSTNQDLKVINIPQQEGAATPAPVTTNDPAAGSGSSATENPTLQPGSHSTSPGREEYLEDVYVFIYAVNYTGTVLANGIVIRELEGKPDVQYSYNLGGKGLRYGRNQIEVDYAELPNPPSTLLEVHIKVSRHTAGRDKEILGEWRFSDKGAGKKTFDLDIPK